jgi:hypothetical protein
MEEIFEGHGIRFSYPAYWEITEQDDGASISLTVASPDTSFWAISLFSDGPAPRQLVDSATEAFREEYEEVDLYPVDAVPGSSETAGCDLDFVCFELINSASLRSFVAGPYTVLVLYQGFDGELEKTRPLLERISASLEFLDESTGTAERSNRTPATGEDD